MEWSVPRDWAGETAFIVCGGESLKGFDFSVLRGRRVVAVNSSCYNVPWADYLIFGDLRWWDEHKRRVRATFQGFKVTIVPPPSASYGNDVFTLNRVRSGGASSDPRHLVCHHTTLTTALNFVGLQGASRVALLGADGKGGWHHKPHKWKSVKNKFDYHALALEEQAPALLSKFGLQVVNCNPESAFKMFPHVPLEELLH